MRVSAFIDFSTITELDLLLEKEPNFPPPVDFQSGAFRIGGGAKIYIFFYNSERYYKPKYICGNFCRPERKKRDCANALMIYDTVAGIY